MTENQLLSELAESINNETVKIYIEAYIREKTDGLSKEFDDLFRKELSET